MKKGLAVVLISFLIIGVFKVHMTNPKPTHNHKIDFYIKAEKYNNISTWSVENFDTDIVCFQLVFKNAGTAQDHVPGTTRMLSLMMKEGTVDMDSEAFQNYLLNHQIQFMPAADADHFYMTVRTTKQNLDKAIEVIQKVLTQLRLAKDDLTRNQKDILLELEQSRHDPMSVSADLFNQRAFKKHPYYVSVEEKVQGISHTTIDALQNALKRFAKDNLVCTFGGHISENDIQKFIHKITEILPDESEIKPIPDVEFSSVGQEYHEEMDIPQSVIRFVLPGIKSSDSKYHAFEILNAILGGTAFKSRLFADIREARGLAYYVSTGTVHSKHANHIRGVTGVATDNVTLTVNLIKKHLTDISTNGVTEEELNFEKEHLSGEFILTFDSILGMTTSLGKLHADGQSPQFLYTYIDNINKVTLDDIKVIAKSCTDPKNLTMVVTGKNNAVAA